VGVVQLEGGGEGAVRGRTPPAHLQDKLFDGEGSIRDGVMDGVGDGAAREWVEVEGTDADVGV